MNKKKDIYIKFKSDTYNNYKQSEFIPEAGEICYIQDKKKYIVGDGKHSANKCKKLKCLPLIIKIDCNCANREFAIKACDLLP